MKFSIIMPSRLGDYKGAAQNRKEKIVRAINSVIDQTFPDWELIVIADGCNKTVEIVSEIKHDNIKLIYIDKCPTWDGGPRNAGIKAATGDYIIYLDIDDYYGKNHLQIINDNLKDESWVWYNDYIFNLTVWKWKERPCNIKKKGQNGTSNVCHKRSLGLTWNHPGYAHDHYFNRKMLLYKGVKIPTPEYCVAHIPGRYDV